MPNAHTQFTLLYVWEAEEGTEVCVTSATADSYEPLMAAVWVEKHHGSHSVPFPRRFQGTLWYVLTLFPFKGLPISAYAACGEKTLKQGHQMLCRFALQLNAAY